MPMEITLKIPNALQIKKKKEGQKEGKKDSIQ
jgi:hypothetical protein